MMNLSILFLQVMASLPLEHEEPQLAKRRTIWGKKQDKWFEEWVKKKAKEQAGKGRKKSLQLQASRIK